MLNVKHEASKARKQARVNGHSLTRFTFEKSIEYGPMGIAYCMVCDVRVSVDRTGMHAKSRFDACGDPPELVFNSVSDVFTYVYEVRHQQGTKLAGKGKIRTCEIRST